MRGFQTVPAILIVTFASAAQAAITYVDAVPDGPGANVTVQGATPDGTNFLLNQGNVTQADDGVWSERVRAAMNGGSVLVSIGALDGTDDGNGILWTSTPTLPAGTYNVYLFFWNNATGLWDISAAIGQLTSFEGLTDYTKDNATNISATTVTQFDGYDLPADLKKDDGNQDLFAVKLGQVVLSSEGVITVSTAGRREIAGDDRTWFDGIGYQKIEGCSSIPPVAIEKPIAPGATSVTVTGISPTAASVNVYLGPNTLIGSAAGNPPNTPASLTVKVAPALGFGDTVLARQVVGDLEGCGPAPSVIVGIPRMTYVDADPNTTGTDGNTTVNGALVDFTAGTGNATTGTGGDNNTDGLWHVRTPYANGGEIWEVLDPEVSSPLVTTLTLAPGTYNLYGLIWTDGDGAGVWDAGFRVGPTGPFTNFGFGSTSSVSVGGSEIVNTVLTREGNRWLIIAPLGQHTVSGAVDIYVDAPAGAGRTWYDGVGYELVSPAPPLPVSDGFGDGDRNNDGLLDDPDGSGSGVVDNAADVGLQWWRVFLDGSENHTVRIAHDDAAPEGLGDDNALQVRVTGNQAYQVAPFPPTFLAGAGDFIRLTAQVRFTSMTDYRDTLRFGLMSDGLTTITSDQLTPTIIQDDAGYFATVATGSVGATARIASNSFWGAAGSIFGLDENIVTETPFSRMINDNAPHTLSLTIIRSIGSHALIDYSIDGSTALRGHDSSTPAFFFNEVGFGSVPSPGISYHLDDVQIEKGIAPVCESIPPITVETIIPADATDVLVNGALPEAEKVNIYLDGNLVGSADGAPPSTPATLTVPLTASPPLSGVVTARQVVNGVESCWPAQGAQVNNCAAVAAVSIQGSVLAGDTTVTVAGVDATATRVNVYANGTTLIGTAATEGATSVTVTVAAVPRDSRISATQIIRRVESCVPSGIPVINSQITYVDAVPNTTGKDGNTTVNGALVDFTAGTGNATTGTAGDNNTDGLWHVRESYANGGKIWEILDPEASAPLITTLTLPPGTYDLYGLIWTDGDGTGNWDAGFRIGATGSFTSFGLATAPSASTSGREFVNTVLTREGNRWLLIAPLGQYPVSGVVDLYVNAPAGAGRTWYDGIGYAAACNRPFADVDGDGDVDQQDFGIFQLCYTGEPFTGVLPSECTCLDHVPNDMVDQGDLAAFVSCFSGPMIEANPACDD